MEGKVILLISTELWGPIHVSKHHYAKVLARTNTVYYLNPVALRWSLRNFFSLPVQVVQEGDVTVVTYGNLLPFMARLPLWAQLWAFKRTCKILQRRLKVPEFDIVWSFDMKRFYDLKHWRSRFHLFHAVELVDHPYFIKDAPYRHRVLQSADLVVSIARLITGQARPWAKELLEGNHGIDTVAFDRASEVARLPGIQAVKAGFVGNFQKSFDFELLGKMARVNPNVDFILIGPNHSSNLGDMPAEIAVAFERVQQAANVHFIGAVPSDQLPAYLRALDINLIIYKEEYTDGHCNPHKMMGYFYCGKVTVSSFIDQYKDEPDLVMMTRRNDDLPEMVKEVATNLAHHNSPELAAKRSAFALDNTYEKQIERIEKIIKGPRFP